MLPPCPSSSMTTSTTSSSPPTTGQQSNDPTATVHLEALAWVLIDKPLYFVDLYVWGRDDVPTPRNPYVAHDVKALDLENPDPAAEAGLAEHSAAAVGEPEATVELVYAQVGGIAGLGVAIECHGFCWGVVAGAGTEAVVSFQNSPELALPVRAQAKRIHLIRQPPLPRAQQPPPPPNGPRVGRVAAEAVEARLGVVAD
eukprot:CAMPEP_0118647616 /NCGR_PEP_ID=MMETSP0785-20121206/8705_1 /TAXON_ID=91992 /ORGANISM="Bolidomonas pacifica, Strain CCMP 1866" /LENGTH=198 /DNA_ID=CAMNT_0006539729 /DNA_START=688 /DNA_END=1283 /DNA_ORIENTATION=+